MFVYGFHVGIHITSPMGLWYVFWVSVGCHGKSNLPSLWKTLQGYWYDNSPRTRWFLKFSWIWTPAKRLKTKWFPDSHFYIHLYRHIIIVFFTAVAGLFECLYKPLDFAPGCCKNKMPSERRTSPNYLVKSRFGWMSRLFLWRRPPKKSSEMSWWNFSSRDKEPSHTSLLVHKIPSPKHHLSCW